MIDTALVARPALSLANWDSQITRVLNLVPRAFRWLVPDAFREAFAATMAFERYLEKHVGDHYSREAILELQDDEQFIAARRRVKDATYALFARNEWLSTLKAGPYSILPRPLRDDVEMRSRAEQIALTFEEVNQFARARKIGSEADEWALIPGIAPTTPTQERHNASPWFVADSGVPVEIAQRYLEAYVAQTTCSLANAAGKLDAWPLEDLRRAVRDWTSEYERALVLIASLPNANISSLAQYERLDLRAIASRHNQRRRVLAGMAEVAASSLNSTQ